MLIPHHVSHTQKHNIKYMHGSRITHNVNTSRYISKSLSPDHPPTHWVQAMYFEEPELQKLDATWQKNVMWLRELSPAKLGVKPRFMPKGSHFHPGWWWEKRDVCGVCTTRHPCGHV